MAMDIHYLILSSHGGWGGWYHHPHYIDEKIAIQGGHVTGTVSCCRPVMRELRDIWLKGRACYRWGKFQVKPSTQGTRQGQLQGDD